MSTLYTVATAAAAKSLQSCLTLCDPIDGSPPGSPVPGILQARVLEWVGISFSNAWKRKVKVKSLSHVQLFTTPWTAAHQAPPSMGFSRQEYWSGVPSPSPLYTVPLNKNAHLSKWSWSKVTSHCDHPGSQHVFLTFSSILLIQWTTIDKYAAQRQLNKQIQFQKYFSEDKLSYEFQHKVYKWANFSHTTKNLYILKHLDTRCCNLGSICPLWTIYRAIENAAQRGVLAIS